jgi:hypothetical protein
MSFVESLRAYIVWVIIVLFTIVILCVIWWHNGVVRRHFTENLRNHLQCFRDTLSAATSSTAAASQPAAAVASPANQPASRGRHSSDDSPFRRQFLPPSLSPYRSYKVSPVPPPRVVAAAADEEEVEAPAPRESGGSAPQLFKKLQADATKLHRETREAAKKQKEETNKAREEVRKDRVERARQAREDKEAAAPEKLKPGLAFPSGLFGKKDTAADARAPAGTAAKEAAGTGLASGLSRTPSTLLAKTPFSFARNAQPK